MRGKPWSDNDETSGIHYSNTNESTGAVGFQFRATPKIRIFRPGPPKSNATANASLDATAGVATTNANGATNAASDAGATAIDSDAGASTGASADVDTGVATDAAADALAFLLGDFRKLFPGSGNVARAVRQRFGFAGDDEERGAEAASVLLRFGVECTSTRQSL